MATLFKQLQKHYNQTQQPELTNEQKCELGRKIAAAYWIYKHPKTIVHYAPFIDSEGKTVKVVTYPYYFIPKMDAIIREFYHQIYPPPKLRKRIPTKNKPIYSVKK